MESEDSHIQPIVARWVKGQGVLIGQDDAGADGAADAPEGVIISLHVSRFTLHVRFVALKLSGSNSATVVSW